MCQLVGLSHCSFVLELIISLSFCGEVFFQLFPIITVEYLPEVFVMSEYFAN